MKKIGFHIFCLFLFLGISSDLFSQNKYKSVRQGNRQYNSENFSEAEEYYGKSLNKDSTYAKAGYNMGNALYKQNNYEEALKYYSKAIDSDDKKIRENALYNSGNAYLKKAVNDMQKGEQSDALKNAIESYINVLKDNPEHEDAKHNLAYSLQLQQQQQQNQGGGGENNEENKDNKDEQNQNQQQNQQQQEQENQQQEQQSKENETKKSDAERMLEAIKSNEKKVMERQKVKVRGAKVEKDW